MTAYLTDAQRRELRALASEMHLLADDFGTGGLPEKGKALELARKVEKALDKRRIKPRPGARAAQVRGLAAELAKRTGVERISTTYDERRREWTLSWSNGPTTDTMFEIVDELRSQGRYPLTEGSLAFSRGAGYRAEVAVVLRHLDQHDVDARVRDAASRRWNEYSRDHYNRMKELAYELTGDVDHPDRLLANEAMGRRVDALYRLDPRTRTIHYEPSPDAWLAFGDRLLSHGWPATAAWLDEQVTSTTAAT